MDYKNGLNIVDINVNITKANDRDLLKVFQNE